MSNVVLREASVVSTAVKEREEIARASAKSVRIIAVT